MTSREPEDGREYASSDIPHGAVVAATELSDAGSQAIAAADDWARRWEVPLVVVHVMPAADVIAPLLPHLYRPYEQANRVPELAELVQDQVMRSTRRGRDDFHVVIEQGSPHAAVVRLADAVEPKLLVVGFSQKSPIERWILGSTAEQILRHAPCSVLLARQPLSSGPVMAATDFSELAFPAVVAAAEQARSMGRELVLIHALDVAHPVASAFEPAMTIDDATLASLRAAATELGTTTLERANASGRVMVEVGDPVRAIVEAVERLGASLVVLGTHGRSGLGRFALGSVAENVVRRAPCPALVVRPFRTRAHTSRQS